MRAVIVFALLLANLKDIQAGFYTKCDIEGADRYDWLGYFTMKQSINDTHEGLVATFKTNNILRMTKQESTYLKATFSDETLSVFTNERFKKFEEEYDGYSTISLQVTFDCIEDKSETLDMRQKVTDVNNHDPVLNRDKYEYHFGMTLPADYDLTKFLSISASDFDFSNNDIYFSIDYSEDIRIGYYGKTDYYDGTNYATTLKTLKELNAPFRKEYILMARDGGNPSRNTTTLLVVSITSDGADNNENENNEGNENNESSESTENGEGNEISTHPPVFAKHLYFASYASNDDLRMEKTITVKHVESDTSIKQSGYADYFRIALDPKIKGTLQIKKLSPLPETLTKSTTLLVIEIEAENKGLSHMPGRTALIIRLPNQEEGNPENGSDNCSIAHIGGSSASNTLLLVFFMTALFLIVVANVLVLVWQLQKRRVVNVQHSVDEKIKH